MITTAAKRIAPAIANGARHLGAGLHTGPVREKPPEQSKGPLFFKDAREHTLLHVQAPSKRKDSSVSIEDVGKVMGFMAEDYVPNSPEVEIKGQKYRMLLRGEHIKRQVQDAETKEGIFELPQDTSVTSCVLTTEAFSDFTHMSTMEKIKERYPFSPQSVRDCIDDSISKMGIVLVPVGMPLMSIPADFSKKHQLPLEAESILPKGTLVEVSKELPEGLTDDDIALPETLRKRCERNFLELFYVRCLPEDEAAAVRAEVKEQQAS